MEKNSLRVYLKNVDNKIWFFHSVHFVFQNACYIMDSPLICGYVTSKFRLYDKNDFAKPL